MNLFLFSHSFFVGAFGLFRLLGNDLRFCDHLLCPLGFLFVFIKGKLLLRFNQFEQILPDDSVKTAAYQRAWSCSTKNIPMRCCGRRLGSTFSVIWITRKTFPPFCYAENWQQDNRFHLTFWRPKLFWLSHYFFISNVILYRNKAHCMHSKATESSLLP